MGIFTNILHKVFPGRKTRPNGQGAATFLGVRLPGTSAAAELDATFNNCVSTNATNLCSIEPAVFYKGAANDKRKRLNNLLAFKPNRFQNAPEFWETVAAAYFRDNVALIWIIRDWTSPSLEPTEFIQLDPYENHVGVTVSNVDGNLYAEFDFQGAKHYVSWSDLIVVQRNKSISDLTAKRSSSINAPLNVIAAATKGAETAVTQSQFIRFLAQTNTQLSEQNQKIMDERLQSVLSNAQNGVGVVPAGSTLTPVNTAGKWLPDADVTGFKKDIYAYFGTNEKILTRSYNEDEYLAYVVSTLSPFCTKLEAELTNKILTATEIAHGNEIRIPIDKLQAASLKTRILMANVVQRESIHIPNTVFELLYLPTFEEGAKPQKSLNFVDSDKANEYQEVSPTDKKEEPEKKEEKEGE